MSKYFIATLLVFILFANSLLAQSTYQIGLMPSINLNYKMENDWALNAEIESRQALRTGDFNGSAESEYNYILTDISMVAAKKTDINSRVAGGYLVRFREEKLFHRFIQQYTVAHNASTLRLAHRFSSDQTFAPNEKPEFRLRYRIASQIALNGESVDPNELYFKFNNEYLNSWKDSEYDLEIRVVPLIGYNFKNNDQIEMGLDYRVNSFLENNTRHNFWLSANWLIQL